MLCTWGHFWVLTIVLYALSCSMTNFSLKLVVGRIGLLAKSSTPFLLDHKYKLFIGHLKVLCIHTTCMQRDHVCSLKSNPKNINSFLLPGLQHLVSLQKEGI